MLRDFDVWKAAILGCGFKKAIFGAARAGRAHVLKAEAAVRRAEVLNAEAIEKLIRFVMDDGAKERV